MAGGKGGLRLLRKADLCWKLSLSDSRINFLIRERGFPQGNPIIPGQRLLYWLEGDVDEWIMEQMEAGRISKPPKHGNRPVVKYTRVSQKQREAASPPPEPEQEMVDAQAAEAEDDGTI